MLVNYFSSFFDIHFKCFDHFFHVQTKQKTMPKKGLKWKKKVKFSDVQDSVNKCLERTQVDCCNKQILKLKICIARKEWNYLLEMYRHVYIQRRYTIGSLKLWQ